jgi:hypothetical protein
MYTKEQIFNLALGALLLQREITNAATDRSNECRVLNTHYTVAFWTTLQDLDLDSTSSQVELELIETAPNDGDVWQYAYRYPSTCVFLRRLQSCSTIDNRYTHIPKRVAIHEGEKVIFTNQKEAIAEYIPSTIALSTLIAPAGLCIAYKLAMLSSALVVGKGAQKLKEELMSKYMIFKSEAQEQDRRENMNFVDEAIESEFVAVRTS